MTADMVRSMAAKPIIFACANPDPEITPEEVAAVRSDAIVATGRSDYPNQVNNVLGFPYIFRGALDVRARTINEPMKIAAAKALAELAREDVPDEVAAAYHTSRPKFGPDYIIPVPFDPRLISTVPVAVARAAMESGVAQKPIADLDRYANELASRLDPVASIVQRVVARVRMDPKRIVFAEGEEEAVMRAALAYQNSGLGKAILVGNPESIRATAREAGLEDIDELEIVFGRQSPRTAQYAQSLYERKQRQGALLRDCTRQVTYDRNIFAASMVAAGHADAMVTGVTRHYSVALGDVRQVIDPKPGERVVGVSIILHSGRTVFVGDTNVLEMPTAEELADITVQTAGAARRFGYEPRVALLAYSTFGQPWGERSQRVREAVELLDRRGVDFEYDGEMNADIALDMERMARYPFCRLKGPANVLIMPAIHSASISTTMTEVIGGATVIGPLLVGLSKSVQIAPLGARMSDIVNMAALAAYNISN
jgi:malate dehydrogenase (oxaloacetate-decarboxylating)(NADP+)